MMLKIGLFFFLFLSLVSVIDAQVIYDGAFGKGLNFKNNDGTFTLKLTARVQPRWDLTYDEVTHDFTQEAWIARGRLKFDGFMLNPDLRYKIEFDVVGGYVRDAIIKYRLSPHSDLWFGQGKLPTNRERLVSSGNLQFVNRSVFNDYFTLDRDIGFQFHHFISLSNGMIIRDIYAISAGSGIRNQQSKAGPSFTTKLEFLPFGNFTNNGDYFSGDLSREKTLKLSFAGAVDYNISSSKTLSHIGDIIPDTNDILTINADFLLKYRGWSLMTEFGARYVTKKNALVYDINDQVIDAFYTGLGLNFQMGYVFTTNWEIAFRYAFTRPDDLFIDVSLAQNEVYENISDHTLGVSRYIIGHKFKVQWDVTYRLQEISANEIIARLQMEFQF